MGRSTQMTDEQTSTVMIVEDDDPTLRRFQNAVEAAPDLHLLSTNQTLKEAEAALKMAVPDILITDLDLPDGNGISLIRHIRTTSPKTEILVISVLGDEKTVLAAIQAGASGYLLKDAEPIDMEEAIRQLRNGGSPISTGIARYILQRLHSQGGTDKASDAPLLTDREREVLQFIAMGYSYKDIAKLTEMSQNTVPTHVKNIYRKLEVNSRGEAVYEALQRGLIDLNDKSV